MKTLFVVWKMNDGAIRSDTIEIEGKVNQYTEKILTSEIVKELGLDRVSVITADMLEGYTNIGDYAFYKCSSLTSVTIPNSVTSIGNSAFDCCSSLTSIKIPSSVTYIGPLAFAGCSGLTSVIIPNSVTSIGNHAFGGCQSLSSVTIGNSVTSIGRYAFLYCHNLASIDIPNSVTSIGEEAFSNCNFKQKRKTDKQGRVVAYKGFKSDLTCRGFQYKEGETYKLECGPILCKRGFHACLNPLDCFAYYYGQIGKDVVFHEVYLEGVTDKKGLDSKVASEKITIGREITLSEMADIASGRK